MNKSDIFGHCIILFYMKLRMTKRKQQNPIALQISRCIWNIFREQKKNVLRTYKSNSIELFGSKSLQSTCLLCVRFFSSSVFCSNEILCFFSVFPFYVWSFENDSKWNGIHNSVLGTNWIFMVRLTPAVETCNNKLLYVTILISFLLHTTTTTPPPSSLWVCDISSL